MIGNIQKAGQAVGNFCQRITKPPKFKIIAGAAMAALRFIPPAFPLMAAIATPAAIAGVALAATGLIEKNNNAQKELVDRHKINDLDNRQRAAGNLIPIPLATLSDKDAKKMKFEKAMLPKETDARIKFELGKVGRWNNKIGMTKMPTNFQSVLLHGPTGSGKSTVARQFVSKFDDTVKKEDRTHYHIKIEPTMLAGENAPAKLEKLLTDIKAKIETEGSDKVAFSIIMDECDGALNKGNEAANQYNTLIDAFTKEMDVPILQILTTNHLTKIDPRTIRPGRCEQKIEIPNPDAEAKREIFKDTVNGFTISGKTYAEHIDSKPVLKAALSAKGINMDKLKEMPSRMMMPVLEAIQEKGIPCSIYDPLTQETKEEKKKFNDLFTDPKVSGATLTQAATDIISSLIIKIKESSSDEEDWVKKFESETAMSRINPEAFITKYKMDGIVKNAMEQALLQRALENPAAAPAA